MRYIDGTLHNPKTGLQVKGKVVCTKYFASAQDCHQAYLELVKVHCDNFYRVA